MKIARLRFRHSGGFAGLVRGGAVAIEALPAALRHRLEQHLAAGGAPPRANPRARDVVGIEIEIETDAGPRRLVFDETTVPDDLTELVGWLDKHAKPTPP